MSQLPVVQDEGRVVGNGGRASSGLQWRWPQKPWRSGEGSYFLVGASLGGPRRIQPQEPRALGVRVGGGDSNLIKI